MRNNTLNIVGIAIMILAMIIELLVVFKHLHESALYVTIAMLYFVIILKCSEDCHGRF